MIRPFDKVTPGEAIPATEYNRAMREVERQSRIQVAAPLTLTSDFTGQRIGLPERPTYWVRVTGHKLSGYNSGAGTDDGSDPTKYSGIEQTDDQDTDTGTYDLPGGIEFYIDDVYLKEVNGRTDVPEGAIVRAYHSNNGPYYTFLFETAFEEYSGHSTGGHDSQCPVWSCQSDFNLSADTFSFGHCPNEFWTFDGVHPTPNAPFDWCGCVGGTGEICWPAWHSIDLQSTGISLACLLACESGQIVPRRACLNVVPGGPFGLRLALISVDDGHELHTPTDF